MNNGRRQLLTASDAVTAMRQHKSPCSDCPFARTALPGWLAGKSVGWWLMAAHGDGRMECHTRKRSDNGAHQCAGAAIFRRNVCKSVSDGNLELERDTTKVFAWDNEFASYHGGRNVTLEEVGRIVTAERLKFINKVQRLKPGYTRCETCGMTYKIGMPHAMFCEASQEEEDFEDD